MFLFNFKNLDVFNLIYNIPLLIFNLLLFFVFLLIVKTFFIMLTSKGNELKLEKEKRNLFATLFWFFLIMLSASVFSLIINVLEGPEKIVNGGEFPILPNSDFPPGPEYKKIGDYYFSGPWPLADYNLIKKTAVYVIMCKKESGYDIIYTSRTDRENLLENNNYKCWVDNCLTREKNLYVSLFYVKKEERAIEDKAELIQKDLQKQFPSRCVSADVY